MIRLFIIDIPPVTDLSAVSLWSIMCFLLFTI